MGTLRRAACIVAALGGSAVSATPITGGAASSEASVVAIAQSTTVTCSGAIIAPHAVLTAAHCLSDARLPDVVEGADPAIGVHHRVIAAFVHPGYDDTTFDHDIAIVIVDDMLAGPPLAYASSLPPGATTGATMRIAGYGWTVTNDRSSPLQHAGTSRIDSVDALRIDSTAAPSQVCEGDSGGPGIVDGVIVGVTSTGDTSCTQRARHTRVDTHAAFVSDILAQTAAGGAGPGDRCWYGANCAIGACLPATDEPRWSFCAPACADGACPAGLACTVDGGEAACRHPWPSPGAARHACSADTDCASAHCLAPAGDDATVCAERCFSDLPGFACPVNTVCRAAADGTEGCFAIESDAGCDAAPGDRGMLLLALVGLAALSSRSRPSRSPGRSGRRDREIRRRGLRRSTGRRGCPRYRRRRT